MIVLKALEIAACCIIAHSIVKLAVIAARSLRNEERKRR